MVVWPCLLALAAVSCGGSQRDVDLTLSGALAGHGVAPLRLRCPDAANDVAARAACESLALDRDARLIAPDEHIRVLHLEGPTDRFTLTGSFYGTRVGTDMAPFTHAFAFWAAYLRHVECRSQPAFPTSDTRRPRTACEDASALS
jgi:hypothetical protein